MSGADEDLWGDEDDDAMLAMIDNPKQVMPPKCPPEEVFITYLLGWW